LATGPPSSVRKTIRITIIVTGIVIVAMWAAAAVSITIAKHAAMEHGRLEVRNLAAAFADEVDHTIANVSASMDIVAQRWRANPDRPDIYAWAHEIPVLAGATIQAGLIGPDGWMRSSTWDANMKPMDLSDREHFRVHLDGKFKRIFISKPVVGRATGKTTIQVTRRVDSADGRFLGVVIFSLSPASLTKFNTSVDLGPHGVMVLAGFDNIVRARFTREHPDGLDGVGEPLAGDARPQTADPNAQGFYIQPSTIDHVARLFSYRGVGEYPVFAMVGLDLDWLLAAWRSLTAVIVAMALCATVLLTGLAVYLIRQSFRDVRAALLKTLEITHSAQHDFLTGLPNRMLLSDRVGQAIALAQRHGKHAAVLFLDLDGFKHINDSLGHGVGDRLLQSIAKRLIACVRGSDTVCRQGGDEFVMLLSEVEQSEDAAIAAGRIVQALAGTHLIDEHDVHVDVATAAGRMLRAVAEPHSVDHHDLHVTASIGVSVYPDDGLDAETLIKNADTAMYQAKENGRQSYQFFKPEMNVRAVERQSIEEDLRRALERQEFALHYQPIIELTTGEIIGAEALIRWMHPLRGLIPPAQFISVAEDCGLIVPIGAWVLREACAQVKTWIDAGLPKIFISVNASAIDLRSETFLENVFATLSETGLEPTSLVLELTESVLMKHAEAAASILKALRERGVKVALDDFGTGYSSLSYLRKFPLDTIKIDQSFVRQIGAAGEDPAIVTAVIAMARGLKRKVIAEGVETLEELTFLRAHHCDAAQGYYFSRPVVPEQFAKLLITGVPEADCISRAVVAGAS
jgi:diguanylate cyclase (GGDEF)-like protein